MKNLFLLCFFILIFVSNNFANCGTRYIDSTFQIIKYTDLQYGFNYDSKNNGMNLLLDVYEPLQDTLALRPLIIFVHGGSFVDGERTDQRTDLNAEFFAQKGYVTANIEYRQQQTTFVTPFLDFISQDNWYKAMIRASHDIKAAIRYFKKDVAINGNTYKIDTSKIFIYGTSAGAIASLHTVFLDNETEMSEPFKRNFPAMGGFDGNSGNAGYTTNNIAGIVSCSGAMDNANYINNNTNIPYIAFHNTIDLVVPYEIGCFDVVFCHLGQFYGDKILTDKAKQLGMKTAFYPVNGIGHPVDRYSETATLNMIREKTTHFLYSILCNAITTPIINTIKVRNLAIFPNPNNGNFNIEIPSNNLKNYVISIYNMNGEMVLNQNNTNLKTINTNLDNGAYFIEIKSTDVTDINRYIGKFIINK